MFITMEYIERVLKENNLLGNQSQYFSGTVMPGVLMEGLLGPILSMTQTRVFIVCKSNDNLILIPCHRASNEALLDQKIVIPIREITKAVITKGNPGFVKATLLKGEQELISIQINNAAFDIELFKQHFIAFINNFSTEGLENLNNIKTPSPFLKLLGIIWLLLIPIVGVYCVFLDPSGEYMIMGLFLLGVSIYYGIKIIKNKGIKMK